MTITKDWINGNVHHVMIENKPVGFVEQFAPKEWKAFDKTGKFIGWFTSKRLAANAI
jgi:hypothetical protein